MIRFIVFGTYSERDRMGNTYSFARVTSTKTGDAYGAAELHTITADDVAALERDE